jgi:hypothetical protein
MSSFLLFLVLFVVTPALFGWVLGKVFRPRRELGVAGWAFLSAALPGLVLVVLAQTADGITAAASLSIAPVFFLLSLLPAGIGCSIGSKAR